MNEKITALRFRMIPVTSSNIAAYAYDIVTSTLRLTFISGGTYEYYDVPPHVAQELARRKRTGESIGQYVHQAVIGPDRKRPLYAFQRIG